MSWSVADASLALFHHTSFDYPVKTESETLEHIGSYAGHLPFAADSHVRPDGYGLLDHQLLQSIPVPMPVSTPKYSRFPGGFEIPPYVSPFLTRSQCHARLVAYFIKLSLSPGLRIFSCLHDPHHLPGALFPLQSSCHCTALGVWPLPSVCWLAPSRRTRTALLALHPPPWFGPPSHASPGERNWHSFSSHALAASQPLRRYTPTPSPWISRVKTAAPFPSACPRRPDR